MSGDVHSYPARKSMAAGTTALAVVLHLAGPVFAQESDVSTGERIWADKAQCSQCHGWAGDGKGGFHHEGNAPSLRATQLSRDGIRTTIQCGRLGTPMPHFDRFAYTDKRCYGITAEELGDKVPDQGPATLQSYEIDALADYVATKIKGAGPVTRAECAAHFNSAAASQCENYPEK